MLNKDPDNIFYAISQVHPIYLVFTLGYYLDLYLAFILNGIENNLVLYTKNY